MVLVKSLAIAVELAGAALGVEALQTATGTITYEEFSRAGVRSVNLDAGDSLLIDNFKVADSWNDLVPVPEPSIYGQLFSFIALALVSLRRK